MLINSICKIMPLKPYKNITNIQKINMMPMDSVSFKAKNALTFETEDSALKYFEHIAKSVNKSIEENDDLTAFETLGYEVVADFETDELTLIGDYKPYFEYTLKSDENRKRRISYSELEIAQKKLLKNVKKITGKRQKPEESNYDISFNIDSNHLYPIKIEKKLENILQQKAEKAKELLKEGKTFEALSLLDYKAKKNEDGTITIEGDYTNTRLIKNKTWDITLNTLGIDEKELLKDVTKIQGSAKINFDPDHYIEIGSLDSYRPGDVSKKLLLLNPEFINKINEIKQKLDEGKNFEILKQFGYSVEQDENGKITINNNFRDSIEEKFKNNKITLNYDELGIDINKILKNVTIITGNADIQSKKLEEIDPDLSIYGTLRTSYSINKDKLFKYFLTGNDIIKNYNITRDAFAELISRHINIFISEVPYSLYSKNSPLIKLIERYTKANYHILTKNDLEAMYNITKNEIEKEIKNEEIIELKLTDKDGTIIEPIALIISSSKLAEYENIRNRRNLEKEKQKESQKEHRKEKEIYTNAINKCSISWKHKDNLKEGFFSIQDVSHFGYGRKADLIANCNLRTDSYKVKKYILENDVYNATKILSILNKTFSTNPSLIKIDELKKQMKDKGQVLREGILNFKLNIITRTLFLEKLHSSNYRIDITDKKNLEFLRSIDDENFQIWLDKKLEEVVAYQKKNDEEYEKFISSEKPTELEQKQNLERALTQNGINTLLRADSIKREKEERKIQKSKEASLRSTIAWVLAPMTRKIQKENINTHIKEILDKNKVLEEIQEQLLNEEITFEQAQAKISELEIKPEDKKTLLAFYKTCWEISGTEEWKNALKEAKELTEIYLEKGIEGINNPDVRARLEIWENQWNIKHKK